MDVSTSLDEWPVDKTVYLTLDLECDYGTALNADIYEAAQQTDTLAQVLASRDVPLSCFLQSAILEDAPMAVDHLQTGAPRTEFHAHSHTHCPRPDTDVEAEIRESTQRIQDQFDPDVLGYRFPDGAVNPPDYDLLADYGVDFSASVFPSWRPGRFCNLTSPRYPCQLTPAAPPELPFTVYSKQMRVPISLSYLKLFGRPFEWLLYRRPPDVIVFDMHMHDLVPSSAFARLPTPYKTIYARNRNYGIDILKRFIDVFKEKGYRFGVMSDLYQATQAVIPPDPESDERPGQSITPPEVANR